MKTILISLLFISQTIFACWADVPLEEIIKENHFIITGQIIKLELETPSKTDGYPMNIATIKVSKILKNKLPIPFKTNDEIKLKTPSKHIISTNIVYTLNTNGVWILENKDGYFYATYPKDFQSVDKELEIMQIIKKQKP